MRTERRRSECGSTRTARKFPFDLWWYTPNRLGSADGIDPDVISSLLWECHGSGGEIVPAAHGVESDLLRDR